jgi:hypothetical protein
MRQSKATNKKLGYIVVPLFIEQKKGETEAEAFTRAGFDEVAEVLGAMLESDDDLVDTIKEMQEARGRGDKFNPRQLHEKIEVIGPAINLEKLHQSIDVEILDRLGISWDRWFGLLQKFKTREGHCRVPHRHKEDGLGLGTWVIEQRFKNTWKYPNQVVRLNSVGFSWDPRAEDWEDAFSALQRFHKREGHCRVPGNHEESGLGLGTWISEQRLKKARLSPDKVEKLDRLGMLWEPRTEDWEASFSALQNFRKREGHCRVPISHEEDGFKLGKWVSKQRLEEKRQYPDRVKRLNSLGFSWDPHAEAWEEGFSALQKYHKSEGHFRVPRNFKINRINLGRWIVHQRYNKKDITADRIKRLNALGFTWKP